MTIIANQHYTRTDLEEIGGQPVVLNLGCGTDDRGIGIDIHYQPDIKWDLDDGLPVADDSVDRIIAEHVLEHVATPGRLLEEMARVIRPTGVINLEVPNAGWFPVRFWGSTDIHDFWAHKNPDREGHWLARRLGNDDERRTSHKSLWTKALLEQRLQDVGLTCEIDDSHLARNLSVRAWPSRDTAESGNTLHELERSDGKDMASGDYWAQTRARIMSAWVEKAEPDRVLDVGCGSGYLTKRIAERLDETHVVGVDINENSIEIARARDCPAQFETADAFDLPFAEERFDVVIFGDVLEHFEQPGPLLAEGQRTLSDDGQIIVSVPGMPALYGPHDEHNDHARRYDEQAIHEMAGLAGLTVRRSRYTNAVPMIPYAIYQRVLRKQVPDSARGAHGGLVGLLKQALIGLETRIEPPAGITLLAELEVSG